MTQGLVLMVVGMGTVFVILSLLVGLLHVSASVFASWPEDEPQKMQPEESDDELELIAIALAAIERS